MLKVRTVLKYFLENFFGNFLLKFFGIIFKKPTPDPILTFIFSGNDYNSHCQYLCTVGFVLKGDDQRLCQADGRWTGGRPHCEQVISHYHCHSRSIQGH